MRDLPRNRHFGAECAGKQTFTDPEKAAAVAKRMRRHPQKDRVGAYRCSYCRKWHIGEQLFS